MSKLDSQCAQASHHHTKGHHSRDKFPLLSLAVLGGQPGAELWDRSSPSRCLKLPFPWCPKTHLLCMRCTKHAVADSSAKREAGEHKGLSAFLVRYFLHNAWQVFVYHQKQEVWKQNVWCGHFIVLPLTPQMRTRLPQAKSQILQKEVLVSHEVFLCFLKITNEVSRFSDSCLTVCSWNVAK